MRQMLFLGPLSLRLALEVPPSDYGKNMDFLIEVIENKGLPDWVERIEELDDLS